MVGRELSYGEYASLVLGEYGALDIDLHGKASKFVGSYSSADFGLARAFKMGSNIGWNARRRPTGASKSEHFVLTLCEEGSYSIAQCGRRATCEPNRILLQSDSAALESEQHGAVDVLAIRLPSKLVRSHFPEVDRACATTVDASQGCPAALKDIMLRIWREQDVLSTKSKLGLISCIIRLMATAFELDEAADSGLSHHLTRMLRLIDREFQDPRLSAGPIAERLHLSQSYIHAAARLAHTTVGELIYERRLQECRLQLTDPAMYRRSITDIALGVGFSSLSHFSRRFRERFGCSPRDYRQDTLGGD